MNGFRKHGTYSTKDGTVEYVGSFAEGDLRHGKGFSSRGYYMYDGDWKLEREGTAKCSYDNGAGEYDGGWKRMTCDTGKVSCLYRTSTNTTARGKEDREEGERHGKVFENRREYVGAFKDGAPSGYAGNDYIATEVSTKANSNTA